MVIGNVMLSSPTMMRCAWGLASASHPLPAIVDVAAVFLVVRDVGAASTARRTVVTDAVLTAVMVVLSAAGSSSPTMMMSTVVVLILLLLTAASAAVGVGRGRRARQPMGWSVSTAPCAGGGGGSSGRRRGEIIADNDDARRMTAIIVVEDLSRTSIADKLVRRPAALSATGHWPPVLDRGGGC